MDDLPLPLVLSGWSGRFLISTVQDVLLGFLQRRLYLNGLQFHCPLATTSRLV